MVVDDAGGLHQGVDDGGADKAEAMFCQILAESSGQRRHRGNLAMRLPFVADGRATDKVPSKKDS